jgi:transposase
MWAIEGTRTYGTGITRALIAADETVSEADRPKRPKRRVGKDDVIDSIRAGREALGHERVAPPRQGDTRDAVAAYLIVRRSAVDSAKVAKTQLRAMIVTAPDEIRSQVRDSRNAATWRQCQQLETVDGADIVTVATITAMKILATRIIAMDAEADRLERAIRKLILGWKPALLERCGVGTISAATVLCSWSHPGRFRSEAAFAMLAGVAPIPASSGQTIRYRLNRRGDRQLNQAMYVIARTRLQRDEPSKAYAARRTAEGRTMPEIRRCMKRYIARELFRLLETPAS